MMGEAAFQQTGGLNAFDSGGNLEKSARTKPRAVGGGIKDKTHVDCDGYQRGRKQQIDVELNWRKQSILRNFTD